MRMNATRPKRKTAAGKRTEFCKLRFLRIAACGVIEFGRACGVTVLCKPVARFSAAA